MKRYIKRSIYQKILRKLSTMPAVAILGPRQCGKTTLAKAIIGSRDNAVYLDLERQANLNKLRDPETFFNLNTSKHPLKPENFAGNLMMCWPIWPMSDH